MSVLTDVGAVVIGRNEGERLARCLRSLVGSVDKVVYVDSGSTDASVDLAKSMGVEVVELDLSRPFTAARARNEGLSRLREIMGHPVFVQFVDGDCELVSGWLAQARSVLAKDSSVAIVCGRRRERRPQASVYNLLCDLEWDTPIGLADSCGGDAMMRIAALEQVNGYDETVIAGEEPELCFRLRRRGLRVRRIDADMTLHDADMTTFGQWWRRAKRAGHACAEGAWRHGTSVERFNLKRLLRVLFWSTVLPIVVLSLMAFHHLIWILGFGLYGAQFWRIRGRELARGREQKAAETYAFYTVLDKFPAMLGVVRFLFGKLTGRRSAIIEYKGAPAPGAAAHAEQRSIAYIAPVLPALSETFVSREILALRDEGVKVVGISVRASTEQLDDTLTQLRDEAIGVYGPGPARLALDAAIEVVTHPKRSVESLGMVLRDVMFGSDLDAKPRWKILVQGAAALALARRLRPQGVVRIHAHFAHVSATIAMYAACQLETAFSFTGHANDLFRERTLLAEKLTRADRILCISEWHRELYRQVARIDVKRLSVVRCAVDTGDFKPAETRQAPARLLSVGRLVEKKGFDVLVRAISNLQDQGVEMTCRIVGDGPMRESLESLIEAKGVSDRVELLGARSNTEVRELLGDAGLFVLPCVEDRQGDRDGIPVVLMEAMASGLCVVAGDLPAIRELVVDEETGVMATPGDVDELSESIKALASDPDRAARLGERGRAWVRREFSLDVNVERLLEAFGITPAVQSGIEGRPLPFDAASTETQTRRRIGA